MNTPRAQRGPRRPLGRAASLPARAIAAQVVAAVCAGRSLDAALDPALAALPSERRADSGLIQELCYGSLRWWHQLRPIIDAALHRPLKDKDSDIDALILIGVHQLRHMRVAPHVAVSQTVEAATALGKPWAKDLINAVLRATQRAAAQWDARLAADFEWRSSHPAWLRERLRAAWPEHWQTLLEENNRHPPMGLRVNVARTSRAAYLEALAADGRTAIAPDDSDCGLVLSNPVPVAQLPQFAAGGVSVQDLAAQYAAPLLDVFPGAHVLDACAAPGGKTCHLLEWEPNLDLLAVERAPERAARIDENLRRLGLKARVVVGDALRPTEWAPGASFDRILLDAPCSATGVIRRHPDIKLLRRAADIPPLVATQAALLDALWPCLRPGGKLLYVTCSVLPEENHEQIQAFVARHPDAEPVALTIPNAVTVAIGRQILPDQLRDGFYYACVRRRPTA